MPAPDDFVALLHRWSAGDESALATLLHEELPWICDLVRARLGPHLRQRGETWDFVQDAVVDVLRDGPRFLLRDRNAFRALLARIVENNLRDAQDHQAAQRRDPRRQDALPSRSSIVLDPRLQAHTKPSEAVAKAEERAMIRLAVELLEPADREIVLLRGYRELEFAECAAQLGIGIKAAQMRFARALPKLGKKIQQLQSGDLTPALRSEQDPPG